MSKFFESKNPLINEKTIRKNISRSGTGIQDFSDRMTISGAVNKTLMLFGLMMITTMISYLNPSMLNFICRYVWRVSSILFYIL